MKSFLLSCDGWLTDPRVQAMTLGQQGLFLRLICYDIKHGGLPQTPVQMALKLGLPTKMLPLLTESWRTHFSKFYRLDTTLPEPTWVWKQSNRMILQSAGDEAFNFTPYEMTEMHNQLSQKRA